MKIIEYFKNFITIATVLSILALCIGFLQLEFFYLLFGINISNFIGVSEIITRSFSYLTWFFLPLACSSYLVREFFVNYTNISTGKINDLNNLQKSRKIAFIILRFPLPVLFLYIIYISVIHVLKISVNPIIELLIDFVSITAFFFMIGFLMTLKLYRSKFKYFQSESKFVGLRLFLLSYSVVIPIALIVSLLFSFFALTYVKDSTQTSIYFKDSTQINTNDSIKYLGKTDKFYFIFNRKSGVSSIYPAEEVKEITTENKNYQVFH